MALRLNKKDRKILSLIAEHKILTVSQLAALTQRSRQVIRRRLRLFLGENLVFTRMRGYGRGAGRPEDIIFLTEKGVMLLRNEEIISDHVTCTTENEIDNFPIDHQLLSNWFHIHLIHVEAAISQLTVQSLDSSLRAKNQNSKGPFSQGLIRVENGRNEYLEFIPDGILSIKDNKTGKTLLFFLEVDMDTEPITSMDRNPKDLRQKMLNYQALFRTGQYKRYEKLFDEKFTGFRLLFLANSNSRFTALCRLVQEMPPSDFIWLTDQEKMFAQGLPAEIWARGGKKDSPPQSIIGPNLAIPAPVMDSIK